MNHVPQHASHPAQRGLHGVVVIDEWEEMQHRAFCRQHALRRAAERGLDINIDDLFHLEDLVCAMAPAFITPTRSRYKLIVRFRNRRTAVVYDGALGCIVSLWDCPPGKHMHTCLGDW